MHKAALSRTACLLSLLFALALHEVFSQSNLAPGVTLYPGNLGLQQNTITCIYTASDGKMWVSTFGGLHQFNGHSFRHIPLPKNVALPANDVIRSIIESGDSLLLASETSLFSYRPANGKFTRILVGEKNALTLLRVKGALLHYYDFYAGALKTIHLKTGVQEVIFADGMVRQVYEMSYESGKLYLKTTSNTVLKINIETGRRAEIATNEPVRQIVSVENIGCVIATEGHFYLHSNSGLNQLAGVHANDYLTGAIRFDSTLYLQHQAGWHRYNLRNNQHHYFSEAELGFPNFLTGKTTCVVKDASGNIWMGKDGFGLVQLNRLFWQFNQDLSLKTRGSFVRSLAESHGKIWAGTQYLELLEISSDTIIRHTIPQSQPSAAINAIDSLDKDRLILATDIGLWTFTLSKKKIERIAGKDASKLTTGLKRYGKEWLISSMSENDLILGTITGNSLAERKSYTLPGIVRCFLPDMGNHVLIGFRAGGLSTLNLNTGHLSELPQFDKNQIIQISRTANNWLFATANGLLIADKALQMRPQSEQNNQPITPYCYALLPIAEADCWVSTNSGLVHYHQAKAHVYTSRNGLQSDEFNGRCALRLRNGQLAFGGVNGVSFFNPKTILADSIAPMPYLESCTNAGIEIGANQLLKGAFAFGEGKLNMHLHFDVTNYTLSNKNALALALLAKGSTDTLWQNMADSRDYYLQGLRADNYVLLAKAANADGLWGEEVVIGTFSISPVFYKTWWFIGLSFFVAIGVAWYFIYLKAQRKEAGRQAEFLRQKALAEMRQQIADDIHDDLGAGLTKLALMADRLALKKPSEASEIKPLSAVARNLTKTLKEVIWATKPENDNVNALQRHLIALVSEMLAETQIQLKLDVDDGTNNTEVSPLQRQHVFQFVREAVHNCIKHAQATTLLFQFKTTGGKVFIYLKDDGIGFNPATIKKGNGSHTQARRASAIGANFAVISKYGGPTEIKLEFTL